jgi:hypothetical protein
MSIRRVAVIAVLALIVSVYSTLAETDLASLKSEFEKKRSDTVEQYSAEVVKLGKVYLKALRDLAATYKKKGDAENVALVVAEIERFTREKVIFENTLETTLLIMRNIQKADAKTEKKRQKRDVSKKDDKKQLAKAKKEPGKAVPAAAQRVEHVAIGSKITVSSTHTGELGEGPPESLIDGDYFTRWSSEYTAPQQVQIDLGKTLALDKIRLHWEKAAASRYCAYVSEDGKTWKSVYLYMMMKPKGDPASRVDNINLKSIPARYVRLDLQTCINTNWGFSLYEIEVQAVKDQ